MVLSGAQLMYAARHQIVVRLSRLASLLLKSASICVYPRTNDKIPRPNLLLAQF